MRSQASIMSCRQRIDQQLSQSSAQSLYFRPSLHSAASVKCMTQVQPHLVKGIKKFKISISFLPHYTHSPSPSPECFLFMIAYKSDSGKDLHYIICLHPLVCWKDPFFRQTFLKHITPENTIFHIQEPLQLQAITALTDFSLIYPNLRINLPCMIWPYRFLFCLYFKKT